MVPLVLEDIPAESVCSEGNLLQTGFWGMHKAYSGWIPGGFSVNGYHILVLRRSFRALCFNFSIAYVPHGPDVPEELQSGEFLSALALEIKKRLPRNTLFIRYDLPWQRKAGLLKVPAGYKGGLFNRFIKAPADIQPPNTVIIDLRKTDEELLAEMKQKTRYNVRLAAKKGITVREVGRDELPRWYELYKETALRDRIGIHSYRYYENLFDSFKKGPQGDKPFPVLKIILAYYGDQLISGIIVSLFGPRAVYLYGASSNSFRNLMAPYLLQWEAFKLARSQGCLEYDLFGIPSTDNPDEPMHGLYRFKTGFGGKILELYGCWDFVYKPVLYKLYCRAEKLRMWYYRKLKKGIIS